MKKIIVVFLAFGLTLIGVAGYKLLKIQHEYNQSEEEYENISKDFISKAETHIPVTLDEEAKEEINPSAVIEPSVGKTTSKQKGQEDTKETSNTISTEQSSEDILDISIDFEALKKKNSDIVGWIYIKGTKINYPVVQTDDNSYYLKHTFNGTYNGSGAIFMDMDNNPDMSDINTILYGHHMKNGSMFASLDNYTKWWFYRDHPIIYYLTQNCNYRIDVFTCYQTTGTSDAFKIKFTSVESYERYLQTRRKKSLIDTSWLPVTVNDNIMTLSTCSYDVSDGRMVVQGKVSKIYVDE